MSHLPSDTVPLWGGPARSSPLYHYIPAKDVFGTVFSHSASTLKQCFVLPKNTSKYYHKYTFLAFPVLGILGLGTPRIPALHWAGKTNRKIHKKPPRPRGAHTRQYKMIMVVQTIQQLHQTMQHHSPPIREWSSPSRDVPQWQ